MVRQAHYPVFDPALRPNPAFGGRRKAQTRREPVSKNRAKRRPMNWATTKPNFPVFEKIGVFLAYNPEELCGIRVHPEGIYPEGLVSDEKNFDIMV